MILNLAEAPYSSRDGSYGGAAGFKDGIVYNASNWLVKYPKSTKNMDKVFELSYTTSPLSEFLGSHIYQILNYDVHETALCFRNSRIAVACKDFCDNATLLEIRTLKNAANGELSELLEQSFSSTDSSHSIDLEELLLHLKYNRNLACIPGIEERFWNMIVVDIFINNSDRNDGNWGILRTRESSVLAPVFDNGGSFNSATPDSRIEMLLASTDKLEGSVLNGSTVYSINGKRLSARQMLRRTDSGLAQALIHNVPLIGERMDEICALINSVPETYIAPDENILSVCSKVRKEFYIRGLQLRYERLLKPAYEQIHNTNKLVTHTSIFK